MLEWGASFVVGAGEPNSQFNERNTVLRLNHVNRLVLTAWICGEVWLGPSHGEMTPSVVRCKKAVDS